jgi:hypothetical protein
MIDRYRAVPPLGRPIALGRVAAAAFTLAAFLLWAAPGAARADLVLQIQDSTAAPGGTGSFDVILKNPGGSVDVGGFGIELSVPAATGVTFTGVNTATAPAEPYIFGTLQSPPFSFDTFPNMQFSATDSDMSPPFFVTVSPGSTFGLAHVTFAVAAGTSPGLVPVSFVPAGSSVSDNNGSPIPSTLINGTITIVSIPEPSLLLLAAACAGFAYVGASRTRMPRKA